MRTLFVTFTLLSLASCSADTTSHGVALAFDPCDVIEVSVAADTTDAERQSLDDAIALWASASGTAVPEVAFLPESAATAGALQIRFEDGAPFFNGQYLPDEGIVVINRRIGDPLARTITVAHELGHALGLPHQDDAASVMAPGNVRVLPSEEDWQDVESLWGSCAVAGASGRGPALP